MREIHIFYLWKVFFSLLFIYVCYTTPWVATGEFPWGNKLFSQFFVVHFLTLKSIFVYYMLNFANLMKCIRERLHKKSKFLLNYFVVKNGKSFRCRGALSKYGKKYQINYFLTLFSYFRVYLYIEWIIHVPKFPEMDFLQFYLNSAWNFNNKA